MNKRASAVDLYNSGVASAQDKTQPVHLQHAYQLFSSCVMTDPTFGLGWYALGNANTDLHEPNKVSLQSAIAAFRRALLCDLDADTKAKCLSNLGWALHRLGKQTEAKACVLQAVTLNDKLVQAWINLALIVGTLGDTKDAVTFCRKAVAVDPDDVVAEMALAFALLYNAEYEEGFRRFEIRFKYRLHQFLHYPYPKWEGEPDKTLFLVADQGLGDTLSFARFVPAVAKRCRFVHMIIQTELMRPFSDAFADLRNINLIPMQAPFVPADGWATFVGLPAALKLTQDEIVNTPHIKIPTYGIQNSWKQPEAKLHIGIAWAGSPMNEIDALRNIPLKYFLDLYRVPGIQLYSLQVGAASKELHDAGCMGLIRDMAPYIHDITDTVSILKDLDLVISVESALGHICAVAEKECLLPYSALGHDYRLGHCAEHLLWTPKHRVFQQGPDQQWEPVFNRIVDALQERLK